MSFADIDLQILQLFNVQISPAVDTFFLVLSYSIYVYLFFIGWLYYRARQKEKFIHLFITVVIGFIFATLLKEIFNRPRPYVSYPTEIKTLLYGADPSFPSRHTFISFLLLKFIPQSFAKLYKSLTVLYLLSVPFAQMYIGVHYPTDVLAGALLGFIFPYIFNGKISMKIWEAIPKRLIRF